MQNELLALEKKHCIGWREYRLIGKNGLFEYERGVRQVKSERFVGEIPLVTAGYENTGVAEFVNSGNSSLFDENTITIDMFGNPFYRGYKYYADDNIISLKNTNFTKKTLLYIVANLTYLTKFYNYGKQFRIGELEKVKITLPAANNEIAFDYIEEFIATLDAERLATLDAYLTTTNLKDYTLTSEEAQALSDIDKVEWGEFKIEKLFGKSTRGRRLKSFDRIDGVLPFVTAGEKDTGISAFIGNKVQVFSENTTTIDMFGSAKYRNYKYGADDHVAVVHTEALNKYAAIFTTSCIHKSSHAGQFDYSRNFYATDADELNILLPIKSDHTPDYDFMSTYIKAMQKVVIKNVVEWADKRIEKTKEVMK
ncbi:MAG: restriction endonuclease subunit S [Culturomica sp.]|jgi:hypothetical protein|nr:restriction endonuclease subunit S [Culturomica sp.]